MLPRNTSGATHHAGAVARANPLRASSSGSAPVAARRLLLATALAFTIGCSGCGGFPAGMTGAGFADETAPLTSLGGADEPNNFSGATDHGGSERDVPDTGNQDAYAPSVHHAGQAIESNETTAETQNPTVMTAERRDTQASGTLTGLSGTTALIVGPDDRTRVHDASLYPFSAVGSVVAAFPDGTLAYGSGAMISECHVLTAAHVIYDARSGGWATGVVFIPGKNGGAEPFGQTSGRMLRVFSNDYLHYPEWDIGLITLNESIGFQTGWFGRWSPPVGFFDNVLLNTAGYPADRSGGKAQYFNTGWARGLDSCGILVHTLDTYNSQSGSPIWAYFQDRGHYIVAVHTYGDHAHNVNGGTPITSDVAHWIHTSISEDE